MTVAKPLNISFLYRFFQNQVDKYNCKDTDYRLFWEGRYRFKTSFYHKSIFEKTLSVKFEDTFLPVPDKYDEWLKQIFGDYMTPPPVKEQVGLHLQNVDFGKY